MRLSIRALTYFLSAAERGSIARAADHLNVAASAISSAIDQVEEEFDLQLVQRYPAKGIVPTPNGVAMIRKIRHVIEEFDNLLVEGGELRSTIAGKLTIGYYAPIAPGFLPTILAPLMGENPDIRFSFHECDNEGAQAGLLAGTFDLIIFAAENVSPGITCELLTEAPPYLLVKLGHPLEKEPFVSFDRLTDEPLVMLDLPAVRDYLLTLLEDHDVEAPIVAAASSTEMVRSLVGAGFGSAILNMRPATMITYGGEQVSAVPLPPEAKVIKLLVGHLGGRQRRLVEIVIDACKDYFASPEAESLIVKTLSPG
ncbi:MAG: LysR family transcriptional regulator [Rhodospirillales bacterium]|jgi:DNA-binding transcriptional LysR family regulator|nr:LysR family transcriptional regulator [Rhodospirillales bacterium]MBT4039814.1 LysR family transcriptional regulator [Rhodospirillales bacterium]MBT4627554.1 LysR family transcriptional regulator [Rhodospirillales bacterium]MBT5350574.1 LysR family transcriptional regulator [Rhodospirillales bacterium]MBT5520302.1 LysR family transcriptional regulator [Rhodospirillales bacterium]